MKMAQGYVTDDGTFFESKLEATLYEAEMMFRGMFAAEYPEVERGQVHCDDTSTLPTLKGYLDAYEATNTAA